jgi:imidazolonepropionase-like amidohydrolase
MLTRKNKLRSGLAGSLALLLALTGALLPRPAAVSADGGEVYALRGGTIVTVSGETIQKGTIVIRHGLIEAVGAEIAIPGDARIIEATGLTIYPGFFDAYSNLGLKPAPPAAGQGGPGAQFQAPAGVGANSGLLPEVEVVDQLQTSATTFDAQRAAGITTALTGPRGGIFQGRSALINLGGETAEKLIVRTPVSLNIGFSGAGRSYPGSLMGVFAFLRQNLLDARHYREEWARYKSAPRGAARPEINRSLESLQPVITGEMPVIFNVATVREMKRAIALAEEFNLRYLLNGGLQSYEIADYLKTKKATLLLSLSYPQRPTGLEDPESEPLATLRERAAAPGAAATLHKAGVTFAFTSGGLTRPSDYLVNARRAIQAGLPKEAALKALTLYPAQIFGVDQQLGSIEKGKIANLVLATGDIFAPNTVVRHVFVDGHKFDIKPPETPRQNSSTSPGGRPGGAAATAGLAAGIWTITLQTPSDEVTSTLTLQQNGEAVSGEVATPFGTARIATGRLAGNELTLGYTLEIQGQQVQIQARGRIEGQTIRGTMEAMGQSFNFNGTRRPNQN